MLHLTYNACSKYHRKFLFSGEEMNIYKYTDTCTTYAAEQTQEINFLFVLSCVCFLCQRKSGHIINFTRERERERERENVGFNRHVNWEQGELVH